MNMNPIFIIGTERSGSNLLRLVLNTHTNICIPHPPHIFKYFGKIIKKYNDLNNNKSFKRLIYDVCCLVNNHIYPWEFRLKPDQIFHKSKSRSLYGVFECIYNQYLDFSGKKRWGCKSTFMIEYIPEILQYSNSAKFIWLIRDPRDVAVSSKKSVFNPNHPYFTANLWKNQQKIGLSVENELNQNNILRVKYEDFVSNPHTILHNITNFLNIPFEEKMLNFHKTSAAKKSGNLSLSWKNTKKPIIENNYWKFPKYLNTREIEIVEFVTKPLLKKFGYKNYLDFISIKDINLFLKIWYKIIDLFLLLKIETTSLLMDKNYGLLFKRNIIVTWFKIKNFILNV